MIHHQICRRIRETTDSSPSEPPCENEPSHSYWKALPCFLPGSWSPLYNYVALSGSEEQQRLQALPLSFLNNPPNSCLPCGTTCRTCWALTSRLTCFILAPVSPEALALLLPNKSLFLLITWGDSLNTHTLTLKQKGAFWVLKNGLQSFWLWSFPIDTERGLRASQLPSSAVDFTVPS